MAPVLHAFCGSHNRVPPQGYARAHEPQVGSGAGLHGEGGQAWWVYDKTYQEKMAVMGRREWQGLDVQLFQEICSAGQRKEQPEEARGGKGGQVCWGFNRGLCTFWERMHICPSLLRLWGGEGIQSAAMTQASRE